MSAPANEVVILASGMTTAIGLSAAETAASARAGTMRFLESPHYDRHFRPLTLALVPDDGLPELVDEVDIVGVTARERRMLRLATGPLDAVLAALPAGAPAPRVLMALPDMQTTIPLDEKGLVARLARQVKRRFDVHQSAGHCLGRAGGLLVLAQAAEWIRSGGGPCAVVGGIDSYRDGSVLAMLDAEKRVKSTTNLDGFIPGEGAGFLLLASRRAAESWGATPMATLAGMGSAPEPGHLYSEQPYRGDGLATAVQTAVSPNGAGPVRHVYSSMNGEKHWAKEWGVAFVRSRPAFAAAHELHHPAEYFGDLGAACAPVLVGLAALGIRDGYRASPCLVYASSDRELRAAVLVGTIDAAPPAR